jgi:hypothetical protein
MWELELAIKVLTTAGKVAAFVAVKCYRGALVLREINAEVVGSVHARHT